MLVYYTMYHLKEWNDAVHYKFNNRLQLNNHTKTQHCHFELLTFFMNLSNCQCFSSSHFGQLQTIYSMLLNFVSSFQFLSSFFAKITIPFRKLQNIAFSLWKDSFYILTIQCFGIDKLWNLLAQNKSSHFFCAAIEWNHRD